MLPVENVFLRIDDTHWQASDHMGSSSTFCVLDHSGQPVDAKELLCTIVNQVEKLMTEGRLKDAASHAYGNIHVQVSVLDDSTAIPKDVEMETVEDLWSPLYLALVVQHTYSLERLLCFHQEQAVSVIHLLTTDSMVSKNSCSNGESASHTGDSVLEGEGHPLLDTTTSNPEHVQTCLLECKVRADLSGSVLLLGQYIPPVTHFLHAPPHPDGHPTPISSSYPNTTTTQGYACSWRPTADEVASAVRQNMKATELEEAFVSGANNTFCLQHVLFALKPLVEAVAYHRGCVDLNNAYVLDAIEHYFSTQHDLQRRRALVVDATLLYSVCEGRAGLLEVVMVDFQGTITPIFRGKMLSSAPACGSSGGQATPRTCQPPRSHSTSSNPPTTSSTPQSGSQGRPPAGGAQEIFWLSVAPQEAHRVAFYAAWINLREQMMENPGSARLRRSTSQLHEYRLACASFIKEPAAYFAPVASIWSGHLFLVMKLILPDCSVEEFMDIVDAGDHIVPTRGIPGHFTAAFAAGLVAAANLDDPVALSLLRLKMDVLLGDVCGRTSALRSYVLSDPSTHAECFEELWIGECPTTPARKFKSRVEMLYYGAVECVLLAAEQSWRDNPLLPDDKKKADVLMALKAWIAMWRGFFISLRDRTVPRCPEAAHQTRSASGYTMHCSLGSADTSSPGEDVVEAPEEGNETLSRICSTLVTRLQHGSEPLPEVFALLIKASGCADPVVSNNNSFQSDNKLPQSTLDDEFHDAQQRFAADAATATNDAKLKFYGLFKQATVGDNTTSKPWITDMVGRAKWEAWNRLKGMSTIDAKRTYVTEYKMMRAMQQQQRK